MCQRGHEKYCINYRSRYRLLGFNHPAFLDNFKLWTTWFEPYLLFLKKVNTSFLGLNAATLSLEYLKQLTICVNKIMESFV